MGWVEDPVLALEGLSAAPCVGTRPSAMYAPSLRICTGSLPESVLSSLEGGQRQQFELELQKCILDACSPHVCAFSIPGGQQAEPSRATACELQFHGTDLAIESRQALADQGCIVLNTSLGEVVLPVRSVAGRIPSDHAQLHLHGLPAEFNRKGVVSAILACAGYGSTSVVKAEFGGELPAALATDHPTVVRGDVVVGVVSVPQADPNFQQLPRCFYDHGSGLRIGVSVQSHRGKRQAQQQASSPDSPPASARPNATVDVAISADALVATPDAPRLSRQARRRARASARAASERLPATFVPASNGAAGALSGPGSGRPLEPGEVLDPFEHMAARMPADQRRGLGYLSLPTPPGFPPTGGVAAGHPERGRPLPGPWPPPPPPSPPQTRSQPALPQRMQGVLEDNVSGAPLFAACVYWLEEEACELTLQERRSAVRAFASEYPTAWEEAADSTSVPAAAFRARLRAVVRRMFERACAFMSEGEDDAVSVRGSLDAPLSSAQISGRVSFPRQGLGRPYRSPWCRTDPTEAQQPLRSGQGGRHGRHARPAAGHGRHSGRPPTAGQGSPAWGARAP